MLSFSKSPVRGKAPVREDEMSMLTRALVAGLMTLMVAAPAGAATVIIETAAPLSDTSEESVKHALRQAVEASIQSAMAMGIGGMRLDRAVLHADRVVVRVLAYIGEPPDAADAGVLEEENVNLLTPELVQPGPLEPLPGRIERTGDFRL